MSFCVSQQVSSSGPTSGAIDQGFFLRNIGHEKYHKADVNRNEHAKGLKTQVAAKGSIAQAVLVAPLQCGTHCRVNPSQFFFVIPQKSAQTHL